MANEVERGGRGFRFQGPGSRRRGGGVWFGGDGDETDVAAGGGVEAVEELDAGRLEFM